jgi:toxin CcdB
MAQFDLYPGAQGKGYLVECQSNLLRDLTSRVVIPLMPVNSAMESSHLNPIFEIDGCNHVLATHLIFASPKARLTKAVANLDDRHDVIVRAIDTLISGV